MNIKRFSKLIDYMDHLPIESRKHFDMQWWVGHNGKPDVWEHVPSGDAVSKGTLIKCGMAACALGWAATCPDFRKAGLKLVKSKHPEGMDYLQPEYKGMRNLTAAAAFFKITEIQADDLFGPFLGLKSPQAWVKHARKKMEEWKKAA